jgi:CMP-N-acetylneuraminic acid synthetase
MKIIGMIPARLGSKRVKNKNLRMLGGKPLIEHIVSSAVQVQEFDKVVINSEGIIFEQVARKLGADFYRRPELLASDSATNDEFAMDFINKFECDILIQLLPTSPFLTQGTISQFINDMVSKKYETLISVKDIQIECIFSGHPINFEKNAQTPPSQSLEPIKAYACSPMGWQCKKFRENIAKYGAAYHGADGNTGLFSVTGKESVDIDTEEDFVLAEEILQTIQSGPVAPSYFVGE